MRAGATLRAGGRPHGGNARSSISISGTRNFAADYSDPCHATVVPLRGNQLALVDEEPEVVAEVPVPVDVQTFESPFGKARAVIFSDGTPWFVAKDVIAGLGLQAHGYSPSNHLARLAQDQKQTIKRSHISNVRLRDELMPLDGKAYSMSLISRGGFNDLVLESRKPVAREYRQWVTDEVLPSLQDTGTFTDKNHPACHPLVVTFYCGKRPQRCASIKRKSDMAAAYTVMTADDLDELRELVEQHLSEGWQLVGSASYGETDQGKAWYQTLLHTDLGEKQHQMMVF